jgi:hypothetical protein
MRQAPAGRPRQPQPEWSARASPWGLVWLGFSPATCQVPQRHNKAPQQLVCPPAPVKPTITSTAASCDVDWAGELGHLLRQPRVDTVSDRRHIGPDRGHHLGHGLHPGDSAEVPEGVPEVPIRTRPSRQICGSVAKRPWCCSVYARRASVSTARSQGLGSRTRTCVRCRGW